jgi:hypothetical protein
MQREAVSLAQVLGIGLLLRSCLSGLKRDFFSSTATLLFLFE